jgi:hypothetical protein
MKRKFELILEDCFGCPYFQHGVYETNGTDCVKLEERVINDDEFLKYEMKQNKWDRDRRIYGFKNVKHEEPVNPMLTFFQNNCPFPQLNPKEGE